MPLAKYQRIGHHKTVESFKAHINSLGIDLPCDDEILKAPESPLAQTSECQGFRIGNRFCIHPMEGWDGENDGNPSEYTLRRWNNFGLSGAKLIWGGRSRCSAP